MSPKDDTDKSDLKNGGPVYFNNRKRGATLLSNAKRDPFNLKLPRYNCDPNF